MNSNDNMSSSYPDSSTPLVLTDKLCCSFFVGKGNRDPVSHKREKLYVRAVDEVSLTIDRGETFGLVGETGCGKTTLGKTILKLLEPTGGKVFFDGLDLSTLTDEQLRKQRLNMQLIFQDPYGSLNARMTVGNALKEPLIAHKLCPVGEADEAVGEMLRTVGLKPYHAHRFPHEFSGGQRQRVSIARALMVNPSFIVCDEPVSALDVSIQAQIINLLISLRERMGLTYLFISHDLLVVRHISNRIGVMYLGRLVETAPADELYQNRLHPYTRALFSAIPQPRRHVSHSRILLPGDPPSPIIKPRGCPFAGRCSECKDLCRETRPELTEVAPRHFVACHLYN